MKKFIAILLAFACCASILTLTTFAVYEPGNEGLFKVFVTDENGRSISNAKISLYSYSNGKTVASGRTDEKGFCLIKYLPEVKDIKAGILESSSSSNPTIYADYMIYATKDGYTEELYTLTKIISEEKSESNDLVNSEEINISLSQTESGLSLLNNHSKTQNDIREYLIKTGKLSQDNPVYILRPEDISEMKSLNGRVAESAKAASSTTFSNVKVPVGEFHVTNKGKVDVKFKTTDKLKVQSALNLGSGWSISGSITRNFSETTTYPTFSTTSNAGQRKVYYVLGNFILDTTYTVGGTERRTLRLDRLNASTSFGPTQSCAQCMKNYNSVTSGYGNYRDIISSNYGYGSIQTTKGRTNELGLSASVSGASLGVTRITGASVEIKYTTMNLNQKLRIYDMDYTEKTYHMTQQ